MTKSELSAAETPEFLKGTVQEQTLQKCFPFPSGRDTDLIHQQFVNLVWSYNDAEGLAELHKCWKLFLIDINNKEAYMNYYLKKVFLEWGKQQYPTVIFHKTTVHIVL